MMNEHVYPGTYTCVNLWGVKGFNLIWWTSMCIQAHICEWIPEVLKDSIYHISLILLRMNIIPCNYNTIYPNSRGSNMKCSTLFSKLFLHNEIQAAHLLQCLQIMWGPKCKAPVFVATLFPHLMIINQVNHKWHDRLWCHHRSWSFPKNIMSCFIWGQVIILPSTTDRISGGIFSHLVHQYNSYQIHLCSAS
jgi:hypothetical protein